MLELIFITAPLFAASYTPPGVLADLVDLKRREIDRMRGLPEAREDGSWFLRLAYPSDKASYDLGRAIGWKPERPVVLADLKRASPTGKLGVTTTLAPNLVVEESLARCTSLGVTAALINTDLDSYGGSDSDLRAACSYARAGRGVDDEPAIPIVAKDLFIDPLQLARAACTGARAVVLIAAACLPDLPLLLDTCTLLGIEALVEVHTPDEVTVAAESGAGLLLVNERDRATGRLIKGQAAALAPQLPADATCLATGGISRLDQVRVLRRAGYDGVVLGRVLAEDPAGADVLVSAIADEAPSDRWSELVSVPTVVGQGAAAAEDVDDGAAHEGGSSVSDGTPEPENPGEASDGQGPDAA